MPAADTAVKPLVMASEKSGVARLRLNRPDAYNALSMGLMTALHAELDRLGRAEDIKVIVIEGAGKGFCAGHDLKEMRSANREAFFKETFATCSRLMLQIVHLPKPVIAKVHGIATAAGCQLVASCDLAIAADTTRFATPGVNIGLFCSTPMVALSRNVGRKAAMEMLLTGEMIDAETAVSYGLINKAVPEHRLEAATVELSGKIASKSPLIVKIGKEAFYRQAEMDLESAYAYTSEVMTLNMLTEDAGVGIDAFIAKRKPDWRNR